MRTCKLRLITSRRMKEEGGGRREEGGGRREEGGRREREEGGRRRRVPCRLRYLSAASFITVKRGPIFISAAASNGEV